MEQHQLIEKVVRSKVSISEEEVQEYYLKHFSKSPKTGFEYKIAHILIRHRKDDTAFAKERINLVETSLLGKGKSFEALAEEFSEDPNFSAGGILGTFRSGEFQATIENSVRELTAGEITKPVRTDFGFHLFKVVSKNIIFDPVLEKRRAEIEAILRQEVFQKQFEFWLEQQRRQSFIRVNKVG